MDLQKLETGNVLQDKIKNWASVIKNFKDVMDIENNNVVNLVIHRVDLLEVHKEIESILIDKLNYYVERFNKL